MSNNKKSISACPQLLNEWDYEKNNELHLSPDKVTSGSNVYAWWKCSKGHSFRAKVSNRALLNRGCPYCSGRYAIKGETDLATVNPELAQQWDESKNGALTPSDVLPGSNVYAWWKCSKGHSFKAKVSNRALLNRGCPYCSGRYAIKGENDLATVNPELAQQWDESKNGALTPSDVLPGSNRRVWWKCVCGHSWEASVSRRNAGSGCPICSHQLVSSESCLATVFPDLAKQWHPTKNGTLTPYDVLPKSNIKVWWICEKGHEFQSTINNKSRRGLFSCPVCNSELKTSFPEQAIFFYISQVFPLSVNRYIEEGYELDVFVPELMTGIEYDGMMYHTSNTVSKEKRKDAFFRAKGIRVIRVKEYKNIAETSASPDMIWNKVDSSYSYLNSTIKELLCLLSNTVSLDIDIKRDESKIITSYLSKVRTDSISNKYPDLLKEWDYVKNGELKPEYVSYKSHKQIWWKCPKGHSYKNTPHKRAERNQGCPYCSGRYATDEKNLLLLYPELCKEWAYDRNNSKRPEDFTPSSSQKVWWRCKNCNNEWISTVFNRTKGEGCPVCADSYRRKSFNDTIIAKNGSFASNHPELLAEWDYSKNAVSPENVTCHSNTIVWWKCNECHNEWQMSITNRSNGSICPICAKKKRSLIHCKPVLQYSIDGVFIKRYSSATEAARETGAGSITQCCAGKCKSSGGFIWIYADKE